ncbi:MAG: hypothetical protein HN929_00935 [Chloroflexi bacterium]|jgi:hypothetical protein|nr:hypothetical protein [Chloroflexota bacterium]MBT7080029.1 hypothetical protein [Chloroflexota bacterium]
MSAKEKLWGPRVLVKIVYISIILRIGGAVFGGLVALHAIGPVMVLSPTYMWTSNSLTWGGTTFDPFHWSWLVVIIGIPFAILSWRLRSTTASVGRWYGRMMQGLIKI